MYELLFSSYSILVFANYECFSKGILDRKIWHTFLAYTVKKVSDIPIPSRDVALFFTVIAFFFFSHKV
jgi:hypothetical protein